MSIFENLQAYRKVRYRTIKDFAAAVGYSASKAGRVLNGHYHLTLTKGEVLHLAIVLGISFSECVEACNTTYAELKRYKNDAWRHRKRRYKGRLHEELQARWQWEEDLRRDAEEAARHDDWSEFQSKYTGGDWYQGFKQERTYGHAQQAGSAVQDCFTILGVSSSATPMQIKAAFRAKVKAAADGAGGYHGDMDKLTRAKEQALAYIERKKA